MGHSIRILVCIGLSSGGFLFGQTPTVLPGRSTTFAFYNPLQTPAPKAPGSGSLAAFSQSSIPVMSPSDYLSSKNAIAPFTQVNFNPIFARAPVTAAGAVAQVPAVSFPGIQQPPPQTEPASPDIAAGPSDLVMVINSSIAQFTKAGVQKKLAAFEDFFSALLPTICPNGVSRCQIFDPSVRYDQLHGRFVFLATSRTLPDLSTAYLLLSVTNGATYDSGWKTWAVNVMLDGTTATANWGDFWRFGFDNVGVYLAGNQYNSNQVFQYSKIRVVLKSDLYNSAATTLPFQDVVNLTNADGSRADSITPVHQRGKPTAVNSQLLVNSNDVTVSPLPNYLTVWKIADPTAVPLTFTKSTVTGLTPYSVPAPAPQLGGSTQCFPAFLTCLDSGDRRILKAVYRNGFLYTARDAGYPDAAITVAYDVVDTSTMTLSSQDKLVNANVFYPAFDVAATTGPGKPFTSIITATTTASDGSLTYAGIANLKAGEDFFDLPNTSPPNRWGDYFGGAVDPVSGGLWTSGQYALPRQTVPVANAFGPGLWGTWIGYFPWVTASAFTDVSSPFFADFANVLSLWQITAGCTTTTFCPSDGLTRSQIAVFLIRSMYGNPCPSNAPCASGFTYTSTPYFTDVPASDSSFPYVQKLRDLGITSGCTVTTYCPGDVVPRWQAAVLIVRGKLKALFGDSFSYPGAPAFADVPPTSPIYPYVQKLAELGISAGCTTTQFCPNRPLTRQEAAVFIVRGFLN